MESYLENPLTFHFQTNFRTKGPCSELVSLETECKAHLKVDM